MTCPGGLLAHSASTAEASPQCYADHVVGVRRGARQRGEAVLRYAASRPSDLLDAIDAAACFHDLGKLDAENQAALREGPRAKLPWDHIDAGVAHLSAVGNLIAAWLVRAHHAPGLPDESRHFTEASDPELRGRRNDTDTLSRHDAQVDRTNAHMPAYLAAHEAVIGRVDVEPARPAHGLTMRLALSCLVDSDHTDTAEFGPGNTPVTAPEPRWGERLARLDEYVQSLPYSGNLSRDRNRQAFYASCRTSDIEAPIVACEGPVGIGKTTSVTAYMLRRADADGLRHLMIVAPYTNIISQTVRVLREALTLPGETAEDVVAEHHHRADFESPDTRALAVLWRAPVIVTTAVQLFETLASNHPGQLRKLHELPGSAVFVDEAHAALPAPLWPQNWRWLRELVSDWNCRVVFASGSLARFWENPDIVDDPINLPELLVPELAHFVLFAERQRVRYVREQRFESAEEMIGRIADAPGPRLVILNTVQSAAVVARAMREQSHQVMHLSTALCPDDRDRILEQVRTRLGHRGDPDWTLVATSCVEAGVDLSFRTGFRERFSTASLIQVGGRINRHAEFEDGGAVHDFRIEAGGGITAHPGATRPAAILGRQLRDGLFESQKTPAELVTEAMREEIAILGGARRDCLGTAERKRNYPEVAKLGRAIDQDTRLVVVDCVLRHRLEASARVDFQELLRGSVQIWANGIRTWAVDPVRGRDELYWWPHRYDRDFLGYMAGVLKLRDFVERGGAIVA